VCPVFCHRVGARGSGTDSRLTSRLRAELGCAVAEQQRCVSEAAAHYGASWPIVHAAFVEHVKAPLSAPLPPVTVLGIDETRRGTPIWAQNTGHHAVGAGV
jgi:transposase